jgi:hypothetical protein
VELSDVINTIVQRHLNSSQLTDLRVGTVVSTNPMRISISVQMAPLEKNVLMLTSEVVEKKIPVLSHSHSYSEGTTGESLEGLACYENGEALPVEDGYIILNPALKEGDRVLLLRVQRGQMFIVLSRVMEA